MEDLQPSGKQNPNNKPQPLRHGWGGNLKLRDRLLRDRAQERDEAVVLSQQIETNGKYQFNEHETVVFDEALFEEMLAKSSFT